MDSKTIYMDYLAHHGVKGMRWGVRRRLSNDVQRIRGKAKQLNTAENRAKAKKAAVIGGAVAAAGLAAYGGYKLSVTRQYNQASIAKFLNSRSDIANSVVKGGTPYKYSGARAMIGGGSYNTTRLSTGKIYNSIKGPTLKATRSTTIGPGGPAGFRGGKQLEQYLVGNKGRKSVVMSKKDRKLWSSVYKKYYK